MAEEIEKIDAWVTKYALTSGIQKVRAEISEEYPTMIVYKSGDQGDYPSYAHGKDWHRTQEAARLRAEEMRAKKIASLEKSIEQLRKLKF